MSHHEAVSWAMYWMCALVSLWVYLRPWPGGNSYSGQIAAVAMECIFALGNFWQGYIALGIAWAALAGFDAWIAWNRRPPRKRGKSRVAGRVHVLGGRLVIGHEEAPQRS